MRSSDSPNSNRFLAALEPSDRERIQPHLTLHNYEANRTLNEPASVADNVYFPEGAVLSIVTVMEDGRGVESCSVGSESAYGLLGVLGARTAFARLIVQIPGPAYRAPIGVLRDAAVANPRLLRLMIRHAQMQGVMTEQSAACNATHPVNARLARWLLLSQDRAKSAHLPLTHEFLSYMLGVQRTTVTTAALSLQSAGLLRYSRGKMEILNRRGLEDVACECYEVVRRHTEELLGDEVD